MAKFVLLCLFLILNHALLKKPLKSFPLFSTMDCAELSIEKKCNLTKFFRKIKIILESVINDVTHKRQGDKKNLLTYDETTFYAQL